MKLTRQAMVDADESLGDNLPGGRTVLLVENAAAGSLAAIGDRLSACGYRLMDNAHAGLVAPATLEGVDIVFVAVDGVDSDALYDWVESLTRRWPRMGVVPVVGYEDQEQAARLLELGCVDYLLTPFSDRQLIQLMQRLSHAEQAEETFVSRSHAGRRLLAMAQRVAMSHAPILITGETGTGKEMMARYIHRFSAGDGAPFIAVNCAAIPEAMLESILFGHERGAFTGAVTAQPGKFEQANGGTLLLDEIGELSLALQAKLLRVLQEQRVERLGAQRDLALDVRVIAATNRDLWQEVEQGRFRSDLLFRLDVLSLHVAPLRERQEDVIALAERFIEKYAPGEPAAELLTPPARAALLAHDWPGNVRELENTLQRALVLRNGLFIQLRDLRLPVAVAALNEMPEPNPLPSAPAEGGKAALRASGKWAEYRHVIETIRQCGGHKSKAAECLGMTPRALRYRLNAMREHGVHVPV